MTYLSYGQTLEYLQEHAENLQFLPASEGQSKHVHLQQNNLRQDLTLPPTFPARKTEKNVTEYLKTVSEEPPAQLIVLIQAGHAALGYFDAEFTVHKVITRYMVRRGQGKTQLTFSKTRGKSRLGSRIRLQQSLAFFREINEKLHDWHYQVEEAEYIFLSCPVRFRHELFHGKSQPPFHDDDLRIRKVPFSTHRPTCKELNRIRFLLNAGILEPSAE